MPYADPPSVVPQDGEHLLGREALDSPAEEVGRDCRVPSVGLGDLHDEIVRQGGVPVEVVAARRAGGNAVMLHNHVHLRGRADAFHLLDVEVPVLVQIVVPGNHHENGPTLGGCHLVASPCGVRSTMPDLQKASQAVMVVVTPTSEAFVDQWRRALVPLSLGAARERPKSRPSRQS